MIVLSKDSFAATLVGSGCGVAGAVSLDPTTVAVGRIKLVCGGTVAATAEEPWTRR